MDKYLIKKSLNNNVLIATNEDDDEVVVIGRGIGFGKKSGDRIVQEQVEKLFVLKDPDEQKQYKELLYNLDDTILKVIISAVELIRKRVSAP